MNLDSIRAVRASEDARDLQDKRLSIAKFLGRYLVAAARFDLDDEAVAARSLAEELRDLAVIADRIVERAS